ncbi:MAG: zinc-ribbon domain-containing protein [Pseudomonadota bacterium]
MEISCPSCHKRFVVSDEKLPRNVDIVLTCPSCKGKIPVTSSQDAEKSSAVSDVEVPIDFCEEGSSNALVCIQDQGARERILSALKTLEIKASFADDVRTLYSKIRYNQYNLIVLHENFGDGSPGNNPVMKYLERLPMSSRRNEFVLLISKEQRTLDGLAAFSYSADAIINESDLENAREIINKCLNQHERFYKQFKDCLKAEGKG